MVIATPLVLLGVSYLDHRRDPEQFVVVWLGIILLLLLLIWLVLLDTLNSMIVSRRERGILREKTVQTLRDVADTLPVPEQGDGEVPASPPDRQAGPDSPDFATGQLDESDDGTDAESR